MLRRGVPRGLQIQGEGVHLRLALDEVALGLSHFRREFGNRCLMLAELFLGVVPFRLQVGEGILAFGSDAFGLQQFGLRFVQLGCGYAQTIGECGQLFGACVRLGERAVAFGDELGACRFGLGERDARLFDFVL